MKNDPRTIYPGTQFYGALDNPIGFTGPHNTNMGMGFGQVVGPGLTPPPPPVTGITTPSPMTPSRSQGPALSTLFV